MDDEDGLDDEVEDVRIFEELVVVDIFWVDILAEDVVEDDKYGDDDDVDWILLLLLVWYGVFDGKGILVDCDNELTGSGDEDAVLILLLDEMVDGVDDSLSLFW